MKAFMDKDFLLETETARHLFHDIAEGLPIVDYHCHISPKEIWEDRRFDNLAQAWLGGRNPDGSIQGDHYKWRLMRMNGVPEEYITGNMPDYERFLKFVEAMELSAGGPIVPWCHLELKTFFGYEKPLTTASAKEAWDFCNEKLKNDPRLSVRGIIEQSNVIFIGTTDDPADSLEWHRKIQADPAFSVKVCPSFRPDQAILIDNPGFPEYMTRLAESAGRKSLDSVRDVLEALTERLEYFRSLGCRAADHGLEAVPWRPASEEEVNTIYLKALRGQGITAEERDIYKTALLYYLAGEYRRLNIAMQIHYSALRNVNTRLFKALGPDVGGDTVGQVSCIKELAAFMGALDEAGKLPKMILYSLNPAENLLLDALAGCFQSEESPCRVQHGAAWWFNDTRSGIEAQIRSLANAGQLGNAVGMLTDSRSFLSYPRHSYYRRILCSMIGNWVENGEYPNDEAALRRIVEGVCWRNAVRYFDL